MKLVKTLQLEKLEHHLKIKLEKENIYKTDMNQ